MVNNGRSTLLFGHMKSTRYGDYWLLFPISRNSLFPLAIPVETYTMKRKTVLFIVLYAFFVVLSILCTVNELYILAIFPFTAMVVMYFVADKTSSNKFKGIPTLVRHMTVLAFVTYVIWFGVNPKSFGVVTTGALYFGFVIVILAVIWERLS